MDIRTRVLHPAATLITAAVMVAAIGAAPSAAAPPPAAGGDKGKAVAESKSGDRSTQNMVCAMYWSPEPQFSASNRTIHYGSLVQCNYAAQLTLNVQIWNKPPNMPFEPAGTPVTINAVAFQQGVGGVTACMGTANTQWQARFWGTAVPTGPFLPNPAISPSHTYPCG